MHRIVRVQVIHHAPQRREVIIGRLIAYKETIEGRAVAVVGNHGIQFRLPARLPQQCDAHAGILDIGTQSQLRAQSQNAQVGFGVVGTFNQIEAGFTRLFETLT